MQNAEQTEWFAKKTITVIYEDFRATKMHIDNMKVFYNRDSQMCIVRIKFDKNYVTDTENKFLYFLINYHSRKMEQHGELFEQSIIDTNHTITWIHNKQLLVFKPDNSIMSLLSAKLFNT